MINVLTGNLDREGGAMFPRAAAGQRNASGESGRGSRLGRWASRVRGAPETFGELPAACLAEEIETPGEGQVRALVTIAGNPLVSTPNAGRLDPCRRGTRLPVGDRHLRQRDHPPRGRDAAGARAAGEGPLRRRALPARRSQRGQLLATGVRARRAGRVGAAAAPGGDRVRPGTRRRRRGARPDGGRDAGRARGRRRALDASPAAIPTSCSKRSSRAVGRSGCST